MLTRTRFAAVTATCLGGIVLMASTAGAGGIEPIQRELVTSGLTRPVFVTHAPGDHNRIFIVEQRVGSTGRVRVYDITTNSFLDTAGSPFFSISGVSTASEQGLLGLAFHPNYAENGHIFVNYTNASGTIIRRYTVSEDNPNQIDPNTRKSIMSFSQPATNHNGGWMGFGPDGYLYISTGDGGSGNDPWNNAQTTTVLLGKMLRIDVDVDPAPYQIPPDNPFVGGGGLGEIWAYGLRNPWRSSFDRETGDLFIGDVGQNAREEFNFQHADSTGGENYGWRCYEGNNAHLTGGCPPAATMVFPFHTYNTTIGAAAIGGYVYRGCAIPSMQGTYWFANYNSGTFWTLNYDRDAPPGPGAVSNLTTQIAIGSGIGSVTSFGEDADGEIYFTTLGGMVFRIEPVTPTVAAADLDCDGQVNVFDLLELLAQWGACSGCKADINGDGQVNVFDLLELLAQWG